MGSFVDKTRLDDFLGGRVRVEQPLRGFRAGTDTVILAASIPAKSGECVLELAVGSGVACCCLAARIAGLEFHGLDIDAQSVARANRNFARNGLAGAVVVGDVAALPDDIRLRQFDHVFLNPPFFAVADHSPPANAARAGAHIDRLGLAAWIASARARVAAKGSLTIIQRATALPEILAAMKGMGRLQILPITSRANQAAKTVVVQGWVNRRAAPALLPPLVLYDNAGKQSFAAHAIAAHAHATRLG